MRFLLDENVPHSVARSLVQNGHTVEFVADLLAAGSPDLVVAAASEQIGAVLVSMDKDFRSIGPRVQLGRGRFQRLSRIALMCNPVQASQRIEKAMSLIDAELLYAQEQPNDRRMIVSIGNSFIRTER
jgi:predicted nuclease of predicted toxin-antitoxin system